MTDGPVWVRLQEYHSTADRLQLIPASAKRAGGVQFEIALDRAGASAAEMVSVDVKARLAAESKLAESRWHNTICRSRGHELLLQQAPNLPFALAACRSTAPESLNERSIS